MENKHHGQPDNTIRGYIDHQADNQADAPFLFAPEPGLTLSYSQLQQQTQSIARQISGLGISRGGKVAYLLNNGYWTTLLFLGTMYGGRVIVPLNAVAGITQLEYVLQHSDAEVLFISAEYREKLAGVLQRFSRPLTIIDTDEDRGPDWPAATAAGNLSARVENNAATDDAMLLYTSGTTGLPKGAMLSHGNIIAGGHNVAGSHQLNAQDRALCVLPVYHINGAIVTVAGPLVSGGSVVMPHRFSASAFWELVARYQCSWFSVVPTIIKYLLERAAREPYRFGDDPALARLRFGRSASAPLPAVVHAEFEQTFRIPMIETMGLTETCAPILSNPMPPAQRKPGSPGVAYGNQAIVVDEQDNEVPAGTVGEILIRGANVLTRYYKNTEASAKAFTADGWFRTGDLGYCDAEGYFFITGRLKELIIKGGENIAPREIDDVLYQHPAILEAAAVGVADDNYGQEVVACVVLKEGLQCSGQELQDFCSERIGRYKTPRVIYFMASLPKGPSGKIQRLKLPELLS
jgi:acyl-CoA synthetase (AMP-forming)/AMP-acid ligase II